jgi:hypothetical protein
MMSKLQAEISQIIAEAEQKKVNSPFALLYDRSIEILTATNKLIQQNKIREVHEKGSSLGQFAIKRMEDADFSYSSKLCDIAQYLEEYNP